MAKDALAALESALRARKLDRTLTTAMPSLERTDPSALAATDIAAVDAVLKGGLPRGQLSEIAGPRSSGRTALLLALMAAATRRGEIAALVDTFDRLDVPSAVSAGIDLDRLLWVRGQAITKTDGAVDPRWTPGDEAAFDTGRAGRNLLERTVDRALKALNLVLQAGGFGIVAIDLADVPVAALKRVPFTTWLRVQRAVEGGDTACVLLAPEPLARSARGVTLALGATPAWAGASDRSRRLDALQVSGRISSPRRTAEGTVHIRCGTRG